MFSRAAKDDAFFNKTGEAVYLDFAAIQRYGKEQAYKRIDADKQAVTKLKCC
jgi:hypothetical protein